MTTAHLFKDEWLLRLLAKEGLLDDEGRLRESKAPYASQELLERGLVAEDALAAAVERQYGIPFASPALDDLDKMALSLIPEDLCRKHQLIPTRLCGERIEVLMANPLDAAALEAAAAVSGRVPAPVFGLPARVAELIDGAFSPEAAVFDLLRKLPETDPVELLGPEGEEAAAPAGSPVGPPVIRLANLLIAQAVRMRASDIHVEHGERDTTVRCRVDGALREVMTLPRRVGEGPLVSRIKIMASMDIADRRRPQDGRAKLKIGGQTVGLRVSTLPTAFGEKAVIRILDQRQAEIPLRDLGMCPGTLAALERMLGSRQGMVLVTGPTGSGKTTTLYAALHGMRAAESNLVTIEDPVEYRLAGVNQVQVNEKAGLGFAAALRSVLRQDPDTVLLGEIRDQETASVAFQAALTGHLLLSTLHTNDTLSTVSRLLSMGLEPFKLAPALLGVVSQRLVRRVCPACRPAGGGSANPEGCAECGFTGCRGRLAVTETLELDDDARDLLCAGFDRASFRAAALAGGWLKPFSESARRHLESGEAEAADLAGFLDVPPASPAGDAAPRAPAGAPDAGPKILIVDDSADNRRLARDVLEPEGYRLEEAGDGRQALRSVARDRPDLVLLDLMMPEMDGFTFVKRLRGDLGLTSIPVLVLTAKSEAESQAQSLELGADDYMAKPFDPRVLRARVQALFRRGKATR